MCMAFANTYNLPVLITHTMNVIGERQHPEKFFPKIINHVLKRKTLTIHSDQSKTKPGSRYYIHAQDVADAVLFILNKGKNGEKNKRMVNNRKKWKHWKIGTNRTNRKYLKLTKTF